MSLKVALLPRRETTPEHWGIGRVLYAQHKYLKDYDIEIVDDWHNADVFNGHTQAFSVDVNSIPFVDTLHGIYFTGDIGGVYGKSGHIENASISQSIRRADAITVPSEWVGMFLKRDCRIVPTVIGHGVEFDEWQPQRNEGYVLWLKSRPTDVCNPQWAYELARRGESVISTFAPQGVKIPDNMQVTGSLDSYRAHDRLQHAEVYLATTPETFGLATLEAMASAVPVLGFDFGGTKDIVRHKVDGYLAKPYDIVDLVVGLDYIRKNRAELSVNARERAKEFTWAKVMAKYANLYREVYVGGQNVKTGVSVVISSYNYARYLAQAIDSVLAQTYPVDEIIVVDDGSNDNPQDVMQQYRDNPHVHFIQQSNQGVASARNNGIAHATQPFIVCLDADDKLDPTYVEQCRNLMLTDKGLGIVYTGLIAFNDEGQQTGVQLTQFSWDLQTRGGVPPATCIPCAAMFRKSMWERVGGYKQQYAPAEDTEFWIRGLASGFTCKVASEKGLFLYRGHEGSASRTLKYKAIDLDKPYLKDKRYPFASPAEQMPLVRSYSEPILSINLTVHKGQVPDLQRAIDSVLGQTVWDWELRVKNESHKDISHILKPYPFITDTLHAPYWLNFDANNSLHPQAIEHYLQAITTHRTLDAAEVFTNPIGVHMGSCCGGNGDATVRAKQVLGLLPNEVRAQEVNGKVMMKFVGDRKGSVDYVIPGTRFVYTGGNNDADRFKLVAPEHVAHLERTQVWAREPVPMSTMTQTVNIKEEPKPEPKAGTGRVNPPQGEGKAVPAPLYQIDQGTPPPEVLILQNK